MKIRKYTASNAQEAIAMVKSELGSDALIINTKKVRQKGLLGFLKPPLTEVMAAIDEQARAKSKRLEGQVRDYTGKNSAAEGIGAGGAPDISNEVFAMFQSQLKAAGVTAAAGAAQGEQAAQVAKVAQAVKSADRAMSADGAARAAAGAMSADGAGAVIMSAAEQDDDGAPPRDRVAELESKVTKIEGILEKVYREVSTTSKFVTEDANGEKLAPLTNVLRHFYHNLVKNEVEPDFSLQIIEKVNETLLDERNTLDAATALYNQVTAALGKPGTIGVRSDKRPTVAIFVGPTGVGKTTTLAKIAADSALNGNLKVGMITADTYRIAAVQQLKTYAEILGIPISVAYTPAELRGVLDEFSDRDLVLIDTAGRSHRNKPQFDDLRAFVAEARADEAFLLLSATTSLKNNREIIRNYDFLDTYKLIFTKADETPTFGAMLNARLLTGKSLSYVTVGQSVPDDIEVANIDKIARNLIGSAAG